MSGRKVLLMPRWSAVFVVGVMILVACSTISVPPPSLPASEMSLGVSNGTTLTVTLLVNGTVIRSFPPGTGSNGIPANELPALPWIVQARSPSGRILTSMTVKVGDVWRTATPNGGVEHKGIAARVDLSCGRLDLWSGPPLLGPMPGPGTPGDCAP